MVIGTKKKKKRINGGTESVGEAQWEYPTGTVGSNYQRGWTTRWETGTEEVKKLV